MFKKINSVFAFTLLICLTIVLSGYLMVSSESIYFIPPPILDRKIPETKPLTPSELEGIDKFTSEQEFKSYLEEAQLSAGTYMGVEMPSVSPEVQIEAEGKGAAPERVSGTTVQVPGIDEPDIVKTDGEQIYLSSQERFWIQQGTVSPQIYPPPPSQPSKTRIIKSFPPSELGLNSEVDQMGDLLLVEDVLVILSSDEIFGYDVSDPQSPKEKWTMELGEETYLVETRMLEGKIYIITQTKVNSYHPCPIRPLSLEESEIEIKCSDIYHPIIPIPADVTYSVMKLNASDGEVQQSTSFVGSSQNSVVYMSPQNIYITYSFWGDLMEIMVEFLEQEGADLVPSELIERVQEVSSYDLSRQAKFSEFQVIMNNFFNSLGRDERLRVQNELSNRAEQYFQTHAREIQKTGIVRIRLEDSTLRASGEVPGMPLNQFCLDEYQNHLRIATTIGRGFSSMLGTSETANDVYILDKKLEVKGSIKDLGLQERIYSARFIKDKGYLVTYRQIDPFFVLDLSDPHNPQLKGELKIPGYSSYLHSIVKDQILGIGKEGSKVKLSLFDVSNPQNPEEVGKYMVEEYWSEVLSTHHAFLLDKKHQIFFLPGSKGGYIFSYSGNNLEMVRVVSEIQAKRALYINDYLYVIGENEIRVIDENNWEEVNELEF